MSQLVVAAMYRFVALPDYEVLQEKLLTRCKMLNITGTFLLAKEGINGTVAGNRADIDALITWFDKDPRLASLNVKESLSTENPFRRMKVKLKEEIVTLAVSDIDPTVDVGEYVEPDQWNELLNDPDVVVIDTRNDYEVEIGTFKNAVNPGTRIFSEFPAFAEQALNPSKHKKVAMFCTGGIRCEKATAYMIHQGFENVYHLNGGILKYLENPPEENLWEGECFVFDDRVTVDAALNPGDSIMCDSCGRPVTPADREHEKYEAGISCHRCYDGLTDEKRGRLRERQKQLRLSAERAKKPAHPS